MVNNENINNKHIGFYDSEEQFNENIGKLKSPWVAYIDDKKNGHKVIYSNDVTIKGTAEFDASKLLERLMAVENNSVCCTDAEMDKILNENSSKVIVTDIKNIGEGKFFVRKEIDYSPDIFFYTYDSSVLEEPENADKIIDMVTTK